MIDLKKAREICEAATPSKSNYETIHEALDEIAFYGTSRPREMGEGDDGDGHYRKIAYSIISIAAIARRQVRGPDSEFIQFARTALPEALDEIESLRKQVEQLTVQLSGCGVAALGWSKDEPAKIGDYGWSASYQDVLNLRKRLGLAEKVCEAAEEASSAGCEYTCPSYRGEKCDCGGVDLTWALKEWRKGAGK